MTVDTSAIGDGGTAIVESEAVQSGRRIVRNAVGELRTWAHRGWIAGGALPPPRDVPGRY